MVVLATAAVVAGCARRPFPPVVVPSQLTLYSLDGRDGLTPEELARASERFHNFPVLGKVEVASAETRRELMAALRDGIAASDGTAAKCFWPRHGLRTVEKGETIDYVICFQCLQLMEYRGEKSLDRTTTRDPEPVFDRPLKQAGVPLAPKGGGGE